MMRSADHILDIGPQPANWRRVIYEGNFPGLLTEKDLDSALSSARPKSKNPSTPVVEKKTFESARRVGTQLEID